MQALPLETLATIDETWGITTFDDAFLDDELDAARALLATNDRLLCETEWGHVLVVKVGGPGVTVAQIEVEAQDLDDRWVVTFSTAVPGDLPASALAHIETSIPLLPGLRDWAWAWTPTVGPAELRVLVDADEAAVDRWFDAHASRFYAYDRTDAHWGRRFQSKLSADSIIRLNRGEIWFIRGYSSPPARQVHADGALVDGLIAGALPVTGFDVIDGDYIVDCATGDSKESLAAYMRADPQLTHESDHPWKKGLEWLRIDAIGRADAAAIEALILTFALPRHVEVEYDPQIDLDAAIRRLREQHPRVHWRFTEVFPNVKRSRVY